MKKKEAKIFKKYGEGKLKIIKDFQPKTTAKGITTFAVQGTTRNIHHAIGNCMIHGTADVRDIMGSVLCDFLYEDMDFETGEIIKY